MSDDENRIMNYHLQRLTRIAIGERCTGALMALDDMVAELTGEVGFVTNRLSRSIGDRWQPIGLARSPAPGVVELAPEPEPPPAKKRARR